MIPEPAKVYSSMKEKRDSQSTDKKRFFLKKAIKKEDVHYIFG
jgi:hypothetical protein